MTDTMTSPEFRRRYQRLDRVVVVTALGRPIGTWFPAGVANTPAAGGSIAPAYGVAFGESPPPVQRVSPDAYRKVAARPKA